MTYPAFIPPHQLSMVSHRQWTSTESKLYLDWLLSVWQQRIEAFLSFVEVETQSVSQLQTIDERVLNALSKAEFRIAVSTGYHLSESGRSISADFGLCFASLLIAASHNTIQWDIVRKPKTDVSYNLPVLVGFGPIHLDPIRSSISHYNWIIAGNPPKNSWKQAFDFWLTRSLRT